MLYNKQVKSYERENCDDPRDDLLKCQFLWEAQYHGRYLNAL